MSDQKMSWSSADILSSDSMYIHNYFTFVCIPDSRPSPSHTTTIICKKSRCGNRCPYVKLLKISLQLCKKVVVCMDSNYFFQFRPSHTTHKTAKNAVISIHTTTFLRKTTTIFSTVLYMSNNFLTDLFRKILAVQFS